MIPAAAPRGAEPASAASASGGWLEGPADYRVVGLGEDPAVAAGTFRLEEPRPLNRLSVRVLCSECQRTVQFPPVELDLPSDFPAQIDPFPEVVAEATCTRCAIEYEVRVAGGPSSPRTWVFRRPLHRNSRCEPYEYRLVQEEEPEAALRDGLSWE